MYICIDSCGEIVMDKTIELAYELYISDFGDSDTKIENLTYHELGKPIKARFSLIIDGSL